MFGPLPPPPPTSLLGVASSLVASFACDVQMGALVRFREARSARARVVRAGPGVGRAGERGDGTCATAGERRVRVGAQTSGLAPSFWRWRSSSIKAACHFWRHSAAASATAGTAWPPSLRIRFPTPKRRCACCSTATLRRTPQAERVSPSLQQQGGRDSRGRQRKGRQGGLFGEGAHLGGSPARVRSAPAAREASSSLPAAAEAASSATDTARFNSAASTMGFGRSPPPQAPPLPPLQDCSLCPRFVSGDL